MNKIKLFKIIVAVLIAITLFLTFTQHSFALNYDISNKFQEKRDKSEATNKVTTLLGKTLNVIQVFATGFAIIMLVVLGIRWISASPSGKAEIKKESTYYILGAIFIFAAVSLLQIIKNFTDKGVSKI